MEYTYYVLAKKDEGSCKYWTGIGWQISLQSAKRFKAPIEGMSGQWLKVETIIKISEVEILDSDENQEGT